MAENLNGLRGALIGFGYAQRDIHLPTYLQRAKESRGVEIVAVADASDARRGLISQHLPEARVYTDYDILIEQERENLDFVDIATPPSFHPEIATSAMENGLHVLMETPLALSSTELMGLIKKAKETKRVLYPCHLYQHMPTVKALKTELDAGRIGRTRSVTINMFRNTHERGVPEWQTHWRRDPKFSGGGIVMGEAIQGIYLTLAWMKSLPTELTAKIRNTDNENYDTEDNLSASLTFPNGWAQLQISWTAGICKDLFTVHGERGAIRIEDDDIEVSMMQETGGEELPHGAVTWVKERRNLFSESQTSHLSQGFDPLFEQFTHSIDRGEYAGQETRDAYLCLHIAEKIYESAKNKCQEVELQTDVSL